MKSYNLTLPFRSVSRVSLITRLGSSDTTPAFICVYVKLYWPPAETPDTLVPPYVMLRILPKEKDVGSVPYRFVTTGGPPEVDSLGRVSVKRLWFSRTSEDPEL